ncbi:MAG TPA: dipicolinate synthase subunit B [Candidatus Pullichristensenella excrementigallinarum]|uniref:Dipicolinate synthase subunit B n=1 Tax=Candidatus Pullichristensenella excrementigallinarum TaxID=2840907 RepID=A0A9D1LD77_9FIRM|nr:dipicolinate synthase subunit B [Candidatus Pullichristensenella excrementigallinarum]
MTDLKGARVGIAMTGSFCTFQSAFSAFEALKAAGADLYPIQSENAYCLDTRFGAAQQMRQRLEDIAGREIWHTLQQVEPIGPKKLLDLLVIAPCTGNTLAKLANAIADTSVTMAAKSHLRNSRPVLIGISSNDGLARSARNLGALLAEKHFFFVPFRQDDCNGKPFSLVADLTLLPEAASLALEGKQMQPILR